MSNILLLLRLTVLEKLKPEEPSSCVITSYSDLKSWQKQSM
jgi:hypothetical protein